ncbi:MAG: hypothetical protein ACIAQU_02675 [Phycisphaerales bacterium JB064]
MAPARGLIPTMALTAAIVSGCAAPQARPVLLETPTPLLAGQVLLTPVDRTGAIWDGQDLRDPPPLLLSDGQRIETRTVTLEPRGPADPNTWLPDGGRWLLVPSSAEFAMTLLVAEIPESALGQSVWMDGRRLPAFWIVRGFETPPRPDRISAGLTPAQRARARELVAPELHDPRMRWRSVMALQRLGIDEPIEGSDALHDAWSAQWAARADAALARLRTADRLTCERLLESLTRWLVTPESVLPVWPTDADAITDLVLAMLRPGATDESVARTAQAFLDRQPKWLAWVADDAGGLVGGAIAVVNLGQTPALLSSRAPGRVWEAAGMVGAGEMVTIPAPASDVASAAGYWEVRLGGRTIALPITTGAIDLVPPGAPIGPFWHDWTLEGLTDGSGRSPSPGSEGWIGGLVHRDPRLDMPTSTSSGWVVYIEVRRPPCGLPTPGQASRPIDTVRLAFGPTGSPRAELTVRCTGLTTFETLPTGVRPGEAAILTSTTDRWAFTLPIDQSWLEPDGTILLGVQSRPAEGPRATWPRPMLPGQSSIGRVRLDPSAWSYPSPGSEPATSLESAAQ